MTQAQTAESRGQTWHDHGIGPLLLDDDSDEGLMAAHAASTLIVFHDQSANDETVSGPQPILMVRRSAAMKFAAGAAVFPGGRVDDDDHMLGAQIAPHLHPADAAARVAAIRETLEETGLGIGIDHDGSDAAMAAMRDELNAGATFSALLTARNATLDLDALTAFARWRPNFEHSRLFDTRFYIASVRGALPDLSVSTGENSHLFWIDPATALAQSAAGDIQIIFPTRRNLERLAQFDGYAAAAESIRQFPPRRIIPFIAQVGDEPHLCIRDDCGYPVICEPVTSALR